MTVGMEYKIHTSHEHWAGGIAIGRETYCWGYYEGRHFVAILAHIRIFYKRTNTRDMIDQSH